jgi:mannosyltransferase
VVRDWSLGILVGVAAAGYALIGIGSPSVWADEGATLSATQRSWPQLWLLLQHIDAVHGVYYAAAKLWLGVVGASPVTLRLLSVLAVGALVATTYHLARLWTGKGAALAAAIACAVLPRTTWMAVEGRSWAIGALLATLSTVLVVRWQRQQRPALLVAYCLVSALGVATNIYLALLVAAHGLALALHATALRRWLTWLGGAAAAIVVATPVILGAAGQRAQLGDRASLTFLDVAGGVLAKQFVIGDTPGDAATFVPRWLWSGSASALAVLAWLLIALAAWQGLRMRRDRSCLLWLLPWLLLPPLVVGLLGLLQLNLYHPRYFAFCVPAFAVLAARGLAGVRHHGVRWAVAALSIALTVPVFLSQRDVFSKNGYDWGPVAARIGELSPRAEGVYFAPDPPTRTIEAAYPSAFVGTEDLTLLQTPAEAGSLDGQSRALGAIDLGTAPDRIVALWSVRSTTMDADLGTLTGAGYRQIDSWAGPQTVLVVLER